MDLLIKKYLRQEREAVMSTVWCSCRELAANGIECGSDLTPACSLPADSRDRFFVLMSNIRMNPGVANIALRCFPAYTNSFCASLSHYVMDITFSSSSSSSAKYTSIFYLPACECRQRCNSKRSNVLTTTSLSSLALLSAFLQQDCLILGS